MKYLEENKMKLFKKGKDSALSILETVKKKKLVRRYILLILSLFISACYFNLLQLPTQIVTGGSSGVSIILNYYLIFIIYVYMFRKIRYNKQHQAS